ncbi:cytochrome P450 family protein [Flavobacterium branchiicola]|uniref:Cytochrome P450 n=1 Tax=Flavobacterium branchiicola TaxID=1114875 RepID=A0ABV9PLF2_9FLAO|nr:cytochrome P450 [Flavobacterium branchiicola]MBS7256788.1 cytochrome P450 [Flavobacterium branchiicola]
MKNLTLVRNQHRVETQNNCPYHSKSSYVPINFETSSFHENSEVIFKQLRDTSPIQKIILDDEFPVWIFSRFNDAIEVLRDPRFIKSPKTLKTSDNAPQKGKTKRASPAYILRRFHMLANDPPDHTRLRSFAQKALTPKIVKEMRPRVQQITNELIDKIQSDKKCDFIDDFAYQLPIIVIAELLGLPAEDREKIRNWSDILIEVQVTEKNKQAIEESSEAFINYLKNIISLRRKKPENDLISAFLKLETTNDHLTENELYATIFLLIIAGHETTVNLISNGMHSLLSHPKQLNLLKNNPNLIHSAVEEMLRFNGPVINSTMRLASEDILIQNIEIKKGEGVLVIFLSANQDEVKFSNSLEFDITRQNNKHIAFGHGIHFCIGAPLARLECEIAINTILDRLPNIKFDSAANSPEWRPSNIIRGLKKFPVVF